ncbi:polysaccharide deacetylase family protein [Kribbella sp. NPDC000426]|uniref:polysaccharide deacetylase family protein n=1 Tax=Kribbella sp. NPDC000426 TaxID=3154255 RepID=UPI0033185387
MRHRFGLPIGLALGAAVAIGCLHAASSVEAGTANAAESAPRAVASTTSTTPVKPTTPTRTPSTTPTPSSTQTTEPSGPVKQAQGKVVYLTFDDGPDPHWTPEVLAVLAKHNAHGTFFMLAQNADPHPELVGQVRAAGNSVGNHSVSHPQLPKLSPAQLHHEVADGVQSKCFRPPYGATNARVRAEIHRDGMQQVLWDVDPEDWARPGTATIVQRVLAGARPGAIILMHDGGGNRAQTVAALDQVLTTLSARGYTFATLSC